MYALGGVTARAGILGSLALQQHSRVVSLEFDIRTIGLMFRARIISPAQYDIQHELQVTRAVWFTAALFALAGVKEICKNSRTFSPLGYNPL